MGNVSKRWSIAAIAVAAMLSVVQPPALAKSSPIIAVTVDAEKAGPKVDRHIFGQFAEHLGNGIYGGIWVGTDSPIPNIKGYRTDVVQALRAIKVPVIRWPGGCFADEYAWREGVGDPPKRPVKVNTNWGGVTETNRFGTHEFMEFSELVGADAFVSVNVGSAGPREAAEWVEYITSPTSSTLANERRANGRDAPWALPYIGIGNELWGCGGNMTADYAADETKRFATFIKPQGAKPGLKIASGPTGDDTAWTETLMRKAAAQIDGIGLHYYTLPGNWDKKGAATGFSEAEWNATFAATLKMDEFLSAHSAIMDKYDPKRRVMLAVDEWGSWYDAGPEKSAGILEQQNSLRDALIAAVNFNIFTKHAERVRLANIAQMVNVLQSIILTRDGKMVLTPTYHVFAMFLPWQDATQLPVDFQSPAFGDGDKVLPAISLSAVQSSDGHKHVAIVNIDPREPARLNFKITGRWHSIKAAQILQADRMDAHNDVDHPTVVAPRMFQGAKRAGDGVGITIPAKSLIVLELD